MNNIRMKIFADPGMVFIATILSEGNKWSYNFRSEDGTYLLEGWITRTKEETEPFTVLYNCIHHAKELESWAELMDSLKETS